MKADATTLKAVALIKQEFDARVRADLERDQLRAKSRGVGGRIGKTGRLALTMGRAAFANSVNRMGREVLTPAADDYWRHLVRKHEHLRGGGVYDGSSVSTNGQMSRFGRVTSKYRDGQWWKRDARGNWVPDRAPRRKWHG